MKLQLRLLSVARTLPQGLRIELQRLPLLPSPIRLAQIVFKLP